MAIKMRESKNKELQVCESCGEDFAHSLEMYDLMIGKIKFTLCDKCVDGILKKCCSASCKYNSRMKNSKEVKKIDAVHRYRTTGK